jgi:DNA-binding winged helix-turn-helix (wHTH) protein
MLAELVTWGGLTLNKAERYATNVTQRVKLSPTEVELLAAIIERKGRALTRDAAYDALYWRKVEEQKPEIKTIDVWIFKLRAKLEKLGYNIPHTGIGWIVERNRSAEIASMVGKFVPVKKIKEKEARNINYQCTQSKYDELEDLAKQSGISVSELLRQMIDFALASVQKSS